MTLQSRITTFQDKDFDRAFLEMSTEWYPRRPHFSVDSKFAKTPTEIISLGCPLPYAADVYIYPGTSSHFPFIKILSDYKVCKEYGGYNYDNKAVSEEVIRNALTKINPDCFGIVVTAAISSYRVRKGDDHYWMGVCGKNNKVLRIDHGIFAKPPEYFFGDKTLTFHERYTQISEIDQMVIAMYHALYNYEGNK